MLPTEDYSQRKTTRLKAIVLDRTNRSEQDLILTMLSDSGEECRAARKGRCGWAAALLLRAELFCELDVLLAEGRTLGHLSEATCLSRTHHFVEIFLR